MLVVHTGNASCHVLSFCFVPPSPMTPVSHPLRPRAPALIHGAAGCISPVSQHVHGQSHRSPCGWSPPATSKCKRFWRRSHGWSGRGGRLRLEHWKQGRHCHLKNSSVFPRKSISTWPLGSQGVEGICFLIGVYFRGENVKEGVWSLILQILPSAVPRWELRGWLR